MMKRFLLIGLIFALATFTSHAQIQQMFSQDFEAGSPINYSVRGANYALQTSIVSGGSRSLKMTHTQNDTVILTLDTLDFSHDATLTYVALNFMHIAYADARNFVNVTDNCIIEAKRPDQTTWTRLNSSHYSHADGGTTNFDDLASFNKQSYEEWMSSPSVNNTLWKQERFNLHQMFQGVATVDKKLQIRFMVLPRSISTGSEAWYLDDITVRASSQDIVTPRIFMRMFPDHLDYPSSRGAKLVCDLTTTVSQGMNGDSAFCVYRVGNSSVLDTTYLHRVPGIANRFEGRIPFCGYDTLIHYHIIAKDSTVNSNTITFPRNRNQWNTYRCVRGKTNTGVWTGNYTNVTTFPFPAYDDNRSEFVYDSAMMAEMGFGPGYITDIRIILSTSPLNVTRQHVQFRLANAPGTYQRTTQQSYTSSEMQVVYDGPLTINQAAAGSNFDIHLQDTFFYAGHDLIFQVFIDGPGVNNPAANPIKHIPVATGKRSLVLDGFAANLGYDAYGSDLENFEMGVLSDTRPWVQFFETKNIPLVYDCGISALAYPSYDVPSIVGNDSVVVWLKNFGARNLDSCGIYYQLDNNTIAPAVNWTGNLAPGDSVRVVLSTSQNFTVGYHTLRAWVGDYIKVEGGTRIVRDHEPYNDTTFSPFAACSGPYSGTRTVGTGAGAHFASLEKCLYALSRCGISAPLTIKLPAGVYDVTKFPYIPGTSVSNYVTFEPATASAVVTFRRSRQGNNNNAASLVDMTEARSIRFHNIRFSNGVNADNRCNVLVRMGRNSSNCQFLNCQFVDSNAVTASAQSLLLTGYADSTLVQNCTFYGGTVGVDVSGAAPDDRANRNVVQFNDFANQVNTAIRVVNQNHVFVDSNYCNDVRTNASYVVLAQHCYQGSRIVRNRVYNTKGACCIGVSDYHGSASEYSVVANNMVVSLDDGTTNMLTTPLNIIKGSYIKAVFNSVRMSANDRVNVAAATFGGDVITNSYFQNNVIATFDTSNYAFSFVPGTNASSLHVDHNCYYSTSGVLNKLTGVNYTSLNSWMNAVPTDFGSVVGNPNFTNGAVCNVDLRSFNALLRNVGTPVPEVTDDLFGSTRNAAQPSLGAYEVTALAIDFTPVEFITPLEDYCGAPASIPVEVAIRNTGSGTYSYATSSVPIRINYSVNNGPIQNFLITGRTCGPGDTIHFLSTRTVSLPSGPNNSDATHTINWSVKCTLDPDDLNDDATWTVISRYAAPAPTVINQNVAYGNTATITPTAGVNTWPVSHYTSGNGRQQRSGISWYRHMDDTAAFYYGPSYTTEPIFADTTFYISQKRNLPLVKITEVQVNRTAAGATSPMPSWMNTSTAFAIELTNCGDYPANLEGDSILVVQPTTAAKIWVLPNVTIQPGENLVLQFKTNTAPSDSTRTIYAPSTAIVAPAFTSHFGVIYRDGHGVADAVAFNNVITASSTQAIRWGNQGIPAAVWQGNAIDLAQQGTGTNTPTAGARRIAWPTNAATASPTATATLWQVSNASNLMHLGETETNLIRYYDNGCEGALSPVNIHVTNVPNVDLAVSEIMVDTGCNLSTCEPVMARVHNFGATAVSNVRVHYSVDGGATIACTDTILSLAPRSAVNHTFSQTLDMHAQSDTVYNLKVWVSANSSDGSHGNDTTTASFHSNYTPDLPYVSNLLTVDYGDQLIITATGLNPMARIIWSDANHVDIDTTGAVYTTSNIYHHDTLYYRAIAMKDVATTHVGTLATATNNNFPSPYNPKLRYVKEQYIYTAAQIRAAGHGAGTISSLSFYLAAMGANVTDFTFSNYNIKMGTTTASIFANTNYISGLTPVYSATNLTLTSDDLGWVKHTLDTPFNWDGTSNIVIEVTRALSTAGITNGANTRYTLQANTVLTKQHATNNMANETVAANKGGNLPDLMIGFFEPQGCESGGTSCSGTDGIGTESMVRISVTNVPNVDASITFDPVLDTVALASCDTSVINVVLSNGGNNNINDYTLRYKIDNGSWQQTTGNAGNLPLGYTRTVRLLSTHLTPGRHTVTAVVRVTGDTVTSNDTIRRTFNVRFCAGEYQIGTCSGSDFVNLATAIDTLHNAGVDGNVIFNLCPQTFNEQVVLGNVPGASRYSSITFRTMPGSADMAKITYAPTQANNYVVSLNNATYINFDSILFYANYTTGSGNNIYATVAYMNGCKNVAFRNSVLRSKKTNASSTNANVVVLGSENHYVTINNCVLDSGYYGVRSMATEGSDNITISNSDILNFWFQGVYLRNTDTINISDDSISAGVATAGKPLTGVYLADVHHATVQRNFIFMMDNATGGKRGIVLNNCRGTNLDRVNVYNNMISLKGTAVASLVPSAIWIDSLCKYVNVYYNSGCLYAGANQQATRTFSVQKSSAVHVLNNIFENQSKGYAAYIDVDTCVASHNYNNFWSNSEPNPNTGARKFVRWGAVDYTCLDSLRAVTQKDINSFELEPDFLDERDLRLRIGILAARAQYNPDVTTDVFGNIRPQIPQPTIGCYEFNSIRVNHDVAVASIIEPVMPTITTGANAIVNNIETDQILVRASFFNNGTSDLEENCTWYAYLADVTPEVRSAVHTLPALGHDSVVHDTVYLESPLGIQDTQRVVVVLNIGAQYTDTRLEDNVDTAVFFIYPAYDLQLLSSVLDSSVDAHHCRLYDPPIRYTIKNVGKKDFPGDFNFYLGYDYYCSNPSTVSFPNIPENNICGPYTFGSALPVGIDRPVVLDPSCRPNLYPTGYSDDITIRFRGWVDYEHDIKHHNDTTNYVNILSNHTPNLPVVHDTMVDYGSYGNLYATQVDGATNNKHFVLHWTRDSVNVADFYTGNNNYNRSTHWSSTPQYFHDSTYYVYCVSDKGCTSYYAPINVGINPPLAHDVSISEVVSPRASGRVYLEKDTVKLRIVNYGSQAVSNIPVAFKWMNANGNTTYLEVHDTIRTTIPGRTGDNEHDPNQVHNYVYVFDTALLNVNNPLPNNATSYKLNAWVYHGSDMQRGNDTLRALHTFKALPESTYNTEGDFPQMEPAGPEGFDITRVSFNEIDFNMPDMIGYDHLVLGSYNPAGAECPTLYLRAGTTDTLTVEVANNKDESDRSTAAALFVGIDYNRDGQYDFTGIENITRDSNATATNYTRIVRSRQTFQMPLTISRDIAQYGFMRMVVFVIGDTNAGRHGEFNLDQNFANGQKQEYLLFVQEDSALDSIDAALTRVAGPRNHIVTQDDHRVSVMLANKGANTLTSAEINYSFADNVHPAQIGTVHWTGSLEPGMSTVVLLDSINFFEGTTDLNCEVVVPGDTIHTNNNYLQYQYHRYFVVEPRFIDSFDMSIDKWYAPAGYNNFTRNYWVRATPNKNVLASAYSQPNAYVTDAGNPIVTGKHGNRSVLYSPIISIRRIRTDTITFSLSKHLLGDSYLRLEFRDWEGNWRLVEDPGARWGFDNNPSWYDTENGWNGTEGGGAYITKSLSTKDLSGDFGQDLQFRFVFTTPVATSPTAAFGEGAAIDNFNLGRARRNRDAGVIAVTHPTAPQFGQTIYPRVLIKNYGLDTIKDFGVSYLPYGVYLAAESICDLTIPPDEVVEYEFPNPFTITNIYPDTFQIAAFTSLSGDIYYDNDTNITVFGLAPLVNDLYMYDILSPLESGVAGDSLDVTVRLRNFGQNDIDSCMVYLQFNNGEVVGEKIVFADYLGRDLGSTEFFNYTFRQRIRATMGTMQLSTWCKYRNDTYPYNDTASRTTYGVAAITDLKATAGLISLVDQSGATIELVIDNMGGRVANNFKVGFWIDNDTNTRFEETFYQEGGIPSGARRVHRFSQRIPGRVGVPINYLTVYLVCPDDFNTSNDTTSYISDFFTDLSFDMVEIEENRSDYCRVRAVITNHGTGQYFSSFTPSITINGSRALRVQFPRDVYSFNPGETRRILMVGENGTALTIPKDPNRNYVGSGTFQVVNDDTDPSNNQTTIIRVLNYFEDVPRVDQSDFVLEQNYPNPVVDQTSIEFVLPYAGEARFFVNDVVGREVYQNTKMYDDGRHSITFSRKDLPSGVYYYGIEFNGERRMHKMIIK